MSPRRRVDWRLVLTLVGLVAAWQTRGCTSYATVEHRLTTVETTEQQHDAQFHELRDDLRELRADIKTLLERLPK